MPAARLATRPTVILLDNGSSRAESTLSLRQIAKALEALIGEPVHPVSLLHSDKVPSGALEGRPADTYDAFLRRQAAAGKRVIRVLPLFFGPSRALTKSVLDKAAELGKEFAPLDLRVADLLYPLPAGEPRLVDILLDNLQRTAETRGVKPDRAVLVDHGSPLPAVTAVRRALAARMRDALGADVRVDEAAMERRPGSEFDFNGDLLEDLLRRIATEDPAQTVILSMLFLSAGRHAGPGGDIDDICRSVEQDFPGFRVQPTPLVGTHPGIIDILQARYEQIRDEAP